MALLAWPASGCGPCPQGSYDSSSYITRNVCGGMFTAPAVLRVVTAVPCGGTGCKVSDSCLMNPASCTVVTAVTPLPLDTAVLSDCGGTECKVSDSCLMNPASCREVCFSIVSTSVNPPPSQPAIMTDLVIVTQFTLDPTGAPTLALPDSRVQIAAHIRFGDSGSTPNVPLEELAVTDGSLSVRLTQDHFEGHVTLNLTTTLGDRISIDNGTYVASGSNETTCSTQD
jgi:hypothetical protein